LKAFLSTNPADYLEKISIPILAIFAEKDSQVDAVPNSQKVENALKKAGNKNYKIVTIPHANHLFQVAGTGLPNEYSMLKKEFEPSLLPTIIDWLNAIKAN
jgi:pimeloyl-ACP methyl ester carboxylesterase